MSNFWSGYIMVLVATNIILCVWLLMWTRKMDLKDLAEDGTTGHEYDGITEYNNPLPRWWLGLFWITIVFAIGYLVAYPGFGKFPGLLGWTSVGEHNQDQAAYEKKYGPIYDGYAQVAIPELVKDERAMQIGARLFGNNCAMCHGGDAQGARGFPNLTDGDWLYGGAPEQIKETLLKGRKGNMPAWGGGQPLNDQELDELASYVLSLSGRKVDPALAAKGQPRFALCSACHGADGKGTQALGAPNLTDTTWLYGGSEATVKETLRHGRHGVMPAWKDVLGEERVHLLAAYVWSLSNKPAK